MFQSYALFPHMSILDNVAYGLKQRGVAKAERYERAREALELVQLTGRDKHRPAMLSGGQQQRVALARALVMNPRVLLLDEPLGALDQKLRKEMQVELKRIQETVGITFVYVTHDQEEALSMSDRVAVMSSGHIEQLDDPRAIYDRPLTPFVAEFIGEMNFFGGEVTAADEGSFSVDAGSGIVVRGRGKVPIGERITLGIRSERMIAAGDRAAQEACAASGVNCAPAEVLTKMYLGDQIQIVAALARRIERGGARAARRSRSGLGQRPARRRDHRQLGRDSTPCHERGADRCRTRRRSHDGSARTTSSRSWRRCEAKPKIDYMHRAVQDPESYGITRRQLLGLGGMAAFLAFAAACGTTTTGGGTSTAAPTASNTLAGRPLESKLQIYNWSQYDAPSTYTKFENLPAEKAAGLNIHETYYSSNDELLAKLNAGAGGYDIIAPSQNAVAQLIQEGKLMAMDQSLLPNLKYLDPKFLKVSYDPTGQYHVIKDYGITMFFYNNKIITEQPKTMKDFYDLLNKYVSKGRTNILDGAEEVVPLALMALGLDPNTSDPKVARSGPQLLALHPQGRHHHQFVQLHQRRDRRQDHPRTGLERRRP